MFDKDQKLKKEKHANQAVFIILNSAMYFLIFFLVFYFSEYDKIITILISIICIMASWIISFLYAKLCTDMFFKPANPKILTLYIWSRRVSFTILAVAVAICLLFGYSSTINDFAGFGSSISIRAILVLYLVVIYFIGLRTINNIISGSIVTDMFRYGLLSLNRIPTLIRLSESTKSEYKKSKYFCTISYIYIENGNFDFGEDYLKKINLNMVQENIKIAFYNNAIYCAIMKNDVLTADMLYNNSNTVITQALINPQHKQTFMSTLGTYAYMHGDLIKAEDMLKQSCNIKSLSAEFNILCDLSAVYVKMNRYDEAKNTLSGLEQYAVNDYRRWRLETLHNEINKAAINTQNKEN